MSCVLSNAISTVGPNSGIIPHMPATRSNSAPSWTQRLAARFYFLRGNLHRQLGNASGERREYQWAVDDFSRALDRDAGLVAAYYNRGVLYWRELENWHRTIRDLTRVTELAPHWHEAWFNRAIAFQRRGDLASAAADLQHYLTVATDPGWRANAERQLALITAILHESRSR